MPPPLPLLLLLLLLTAAADFSNVIREKERKRVTYRGNRRSKLLSGEGFARHCTRTENRPRASRASATWMAPWMNKKEINGITNPVLRSIVMLSRACTRSNAVDHRFSLLISFLTRFSELSFLRFPSSLWWKLRDGRLNRDAVSDRDEHPDDGRFVSRSISRTYYFLFVLCDFAMRAKRKKRRRTKRRRRRIRRRGRKDRADLFRSFLSLR